LVGTRPRTAERYNEKHDEESRGAKNMKHAVYREETIRRKRVGSENRKSRKHQRVAAVTSVVGKRGAAKRGKEFL